MIQSISLYLVNILSSSNSFSELDKEKMAYSLSALLSDFSKLVILFIFFTVMNNGKIFLIMFVFSTILRINVGGFHFKRYWTCLAFSLMYYNSLLFVNRLAIDEIFFIFLFILFSIILIWIAPLVSKKRESIRKAKKSRYKIVTFTIVLSYLILYIFINNTFTKVGLWIIILQSLQLLIMKGVREYESSKKKTRI